MHIYQKFQICQIASCKIITGLRPFSSAFIFCCYWVGLRSGPTRWFLHHNSHKAVTTSEFSCNSISQNAFAYIKGQRHVAQKHTAQCIILCFSQIMGINDRNSHTVGHFFKKVDHVEIAFSKLLRTKDWIKIQDQNTGCLSRLPWSYKHTPTNGSLRVSPWLPYWDPSLGGKLGGVEIAQRGL